MNNETRMLNDTPDIIGGSHMDGYNTNSITDNFNNRVNTL